MDLSLVSELLEVDNLAEVNRLLREGWILMNQRQPLTSNGNAKPVYVLAKARQVTEIVDVSTRDRFSASYEHPYFTANDYLKNGWTLLEQYVANYPDCDGERDQCVHYVIAWLKGGSPVYPKKEKADVTGGW